MANARSMSVGTLTRRLDEYIESALAFDGFGGFPRVMNPKALAGLVEHFLGSALPNHINGRTVSTTGTPSISLRSDPGGVVRLALDATSEVQVAALDFNDVLPIDPSKKVVVEAGIKLVSNLAANQKVVVGLAAAHNNDPDLIARSLWLALNGTNDAYVESDDGTTDVSVDSGVDLVAGTLYHVRVEVLSTSKANIYLNGRHLNPSTALKVGSGTLQPYIAVTKSTGTGTPALDVDYLAVYNAV